MNPEQDFFLLALVDDFRTFEWDYPKMVYQKTQELLY
jgi:hypothetical protein